MTNERLQIGYLEVQNRPTVNGTGVLLQGEAAGGSVENVVYTTGNQTVSGFKTFQTDSEGTFTPVAHFFAPNNTGEENETFIRIGLTDSNQSAQFGYKYLDYENDRVFISLFNADRLLQVDRNSNVINQNNEPVLNLLNKTLNFEDVSVANKLNLSGSSLNFYPVIETGATVTVTQANNAVTQTIDTVSDDVELTRGSYGVLYNPINDAEGDSNPTNTEWNTDGWADLSNLSSRSYIDLSQVGGGGNFGNAVIGTELIMHDTSTDKYHKFLFSAWQQGAGGSEGYRGFSYTRTEIVSVSNVEINGTGVGGNLDFYNRPSVSGIGVLLIGEAGQVPDTVVQTSGTQTISGSKTFTASTLFTSNIQASNIQASNIQANSTGIFSDMQISADEMNLSGLDLTISSGNLVLSSPTGIPATTGASGIKGSFVWDSGFLYVCTNTNSWKRAALTTW
jgi:hypothetical protein